MKEERREEEEEEEERNERKYLPRCGEEPRGNGAGEEDPKSTR